MDIDLIFKIAAIGIIVAVLNQLLIRSGREDQAMMTTLAGLVVVLSILVKQISVLLSPSSPSLRYERPHDAGACGDGGCAVHPVPEKRPGFRAVRLDGSRCPCTMEISTAAQTVLSGLTKLEQRAGGDAFSCLLRCTGVILLADYAHSLCEEAGAESLAWCTALAGRVLVLAAAWPLLEEIGQKIGSIAG